jgi:uncharacterized protein YlxW (UPF0749 family)
LKKDYEESKYIRELRKEIRKLRQENASLRKKNNRLENLIDYTEYQDDSNHDNIDTMTCPVCGDRKAEKIEIGVFLFSKCKKCESLRKIKKLVS